MVTLIGKDKHTRSLETGNKLASSFSCCFVIISGGGNKFVHGRTVYDRQISNNSWRGSGNLCNFSGYGGNSCLPQNNKH